MRDPAALLVDGGRKREGGRGARSERGGEVEVMKVSNGGIEKNGVAHLAERSLSRGFESTQVIYFSTCSKFNCLPFICFALYSYYDAIVT